VGGGGLVVVEDYHDQQPVAAAEVPEHPGYGVGADYGGQQAQVHDDHHRAGEQDHQADKHLGRRGGEERLKVKGRRGEGEIERGDDGKRGEEKRKRVKRKGSRERKRRKEVERRGEKE